MKALCNTLVSIAVAAFIFAGCTGPAYVATRTYYHPSYGYHYGDGQPDGYYYDPHTQTYQYQQSVNVTVSPNALSFNDFYTHLSPHGVWVNLQPYGQVWVANERNFQPYSTNGYWTYTNYGWTWVSNYSWGWAPFHYGRWGYDNRYGWYWVPGYEWGPAWVAWSSSSDMYGWAPLLPGMNYGVRLTVNLFPSRYWTFMPGRYMGSTNISGYYVNRSRNTTIIKNTTIINNYGTENNRRYSMGPSVNEVQRYTGRDIQPIRVSSTSDSRSAGISNNEYRVYRPTGEASSRSSTAPATDNRVSTPSTRTQPNQTTTRTSTPQTQTQTSQSTEREYRPTQEQPRVSNRAAPQTTRQIQRAQSDNISTRQQEQQQQSQQSTRSSQPRQSQQDTQQQQQQQRRSSTTTSSSRSR